MRTFNTGLCAAALVSLLAAGLTTADESHVHADHRQLSGRKSPTTHVRACTTIVVSTWNPSCTKKQYRLNPASCAEVVFTSGTRQLFDCRDVARLKLTADMYQNNTPAGLTAIGSFSYSVQSVANGHMPQTVNITIAANDSSCGSVQFTSNKGFFKRIWWPHYTFSSHLMRPVSATGAFANITGFASAFKTCIGFRPVKHTTVGVSVIPVEVKIHYKKMLGPNLPINCTTRRLQPDDDQFAGIVLPDLPLTRDGPHPIESHHASHHVMSRLRGLAGAIVPARPSHAFAMCVPATKKALQLAYTQITMLREAYGAQDEKFLIYHADELDTSSDEVSALLAIPNVEVHDLLDFFEHKYFASEEEKARSLTHAPALRVKVPTAEGKEPEWVEEPVKTMRDYVKRFRGYYCKPAALVAAEYNEVTMLDLDLMLMGSPLALRDTKQYQEAGAYLFRDQPSYWNAGGSCKVPQAKLTSYRQVIKDLYTDIHPSTDGKHAYLPESLIESPVFQGSSFDVGESAIVLMNKGKNAAAMKVLKALLGPEHIGKLWDHILGDKELYWLSMAMSGVIAPFNPYTWVASGSETHDVADNVKVTCCHKGLLGQWVPFASSSLSGGSSAALELRQKTPFFQNITEASKAQMAAFLAMEETEACMDYKLTATAAARMSESERRLSEEQGDEVRLMYMNGDGVEDMIRGEGLSLKEISIGAPLAYEEAVCVPLYCSPGPRPLPKEVSLAYPLYRIAFNMARQAIGDEPKQ